MQEYLQNLQPELPANEGAMTIVQLGKYNRFHIELPTEQMTAPKINQQGKLKVEVSLTDEGIDKLMTIHEDVAKALPNWFEGVAVDHRLPYYEGRINVGFAGEYGKPGEYKKINIATKDGASMVNTTELAKIIQQPKNVIVNVALWISKKDKNYRMGYWYQLHMVNY